MVILLPLELRGGNMERNQGEISEILGAVNENDLVKQRVVLISEGIDSRVAKRVMSQLLRMEAADPGKPIHIYQNSPGGEVTSGFAIFDMIRFISSEVRIINVGLCASIATVINCATSKENRYATPSAKFLIHQPLIAGTIRGQASDLEITANDIIKTKERINRLLADECGQPYEKVAQDTIRDYWMSASEALEYGLVSKIVESISEVK